MVSKILKNKSWFSSGALLVFMLGCCCLASAQDLQYTQFYANPLYHNPAFAGSSLATRFFFNYRNQWPSLGGGFRSFSFSSDHYLKKAESGLGFLVFRDRAGEAPLRTTGVQAMYAKRVKLGSRFRMQGGLQLGVVQKEANFFDYTFGDMIATEGIQRPTAEILAGNPTQKFYPVVSSGVLFYSQKVWLGISAHNINRPATNFFQDQSRLPIRYTAIAGWKIDIDNKRYLERGQISRSVMPAVMVRQQGSFQQIDLGAYVNLNPLVLGVWYRGVASSFGPTTTGRDALNLLLGLKQDNLSLGYSYDINLSGLVPFLDGSHEFSIIYEFEPDRPFKKPTQKSKALPCPTF